ncbi:MAG TPA: EpsI family protein, partial [Burkholderiaceae bacterium]|nr:EpsI family protein [Burkholderiaceae bacterium]
RETSRPEPRSVRARSGPADGTERHAAAFALLALVIVGFAPLSAEMLGRRLETGMSQPLIAPTLAAPWKPRDAAFRSWEPRFVSSTAELNQTYTSGGTPVRLYMAYFAPGHRGAKVVSTGNMLYNPPIWRRLREDKVVASCGGRTFQARETFIASATSALVLWNFYWVDGRCTANAYLAKFLLAKARLLGSREGSAAIVLAAAGEPVQAAVALRDFMAHLSWERIVRPSP